MARKEFYRIETSNYLFPSRCRLNGDRDTPEEPVRQWCAYELIRGYGILITDLEFERQVKVGSKSYEIDILVSRAGKPWAVFECKKPSHTKHEDGMAQAISYAGAQGIQAPFAIYTNGTVWNVQRNYRGQWVPVPDIPIFIDEHAQQPIGNLLETLYQAAPLLYILHQPIDGKDAKRFFGKLQYFFHGWNSLTWQAGDGSLHCGIEYFLRVLSVGKGDDVYCHGKLESARGCFENFRKSAGFPWELHPFDSAQVFSSRIHTLHSALSGLLNGTKGLNAYDAYSLRLGVALLEYGCRWSLAKEPYLPVQENVKKALEEFLSYSFAVRFNVSLPDALDKTSVGDLQSYCHQAWESDEGRC